MYFFNKFYRTVNIINKVNYGNETPGYPMFPVKLQKNERKSPKLQKL